MDGELQHIHLLFHGSKFEFDIVCNNTPCIGLVPSSPILCEPYLAHISPCRSHSRCMSEGVDAHVWSFLILWSIRLMSFCTCLELYSVFVYTGYHIGQKAFNFLNLPIFFKNWEIQDSRISIFFFCDRFLDWILEKKIENSKKNWLTVNSISQF